MLAFTKAGTKLNVFSPETYLQGHAHGLLDHLLLQLTGTLVHEHVCAHYIPVSGLLLVYLWVEPKVGNKIILHSYRAFGGGTQL